MATLLGVALVAVHFLIFSQFFPNQQGLLGHDYSMFMPHLLDGYYWFHHNGLFSVPWFTPSFCGGVPKFPNPQSSFYSVPQFLTFLMNPVWALQGTLLIFSSLGYWGFYLLSRRIFAASRWTAVLASGLFLFNGFFVHRLMVGHMTYHAFMVLPMLTFLVARPLSLPGKSPSHEGSNSSIWLWRAGFDVVIAGLLVAYMIFAGMVNVIVPVMMAVVMLLCLFGLAVPSRFNWKLVSVKFVLASVWGGVLSAAQLVAALSYLKHFPRDQYRLPGFENVWDLVVAVGQSIFFQPAHELVAKAMVNIQWGLDRHEMEYGITFIPLAILVVSAIWHGVHFKQMPWWKRLNSIQWFCLVSLVAMLAVPLVLNYYQPSWNSFLKQMPLIKSSSSLVRWFCIYIPVFIVFMVLAIENTSLLKRIAMPIGGIGILILVGINFWTDRGFYHAQNYDYQAINQVRDVIKEGKWSPAIDRVVVYTNDKGEIQVPLDRNNVLVNGQSYLFCYESIFGYRLENLPLKNLRPGLTNQESNGVVNIKNPACYAFPEENQCTPGDHFSVAEKSKAQAFTSFQPYEFEMPTRQKMANWLTLLSLIGMIGFWGGCGFLYLRKSKTEEREPKADQPPQNEVPPQNGRSSKQKAHKKKRNK